MEHRLIPGCEGALFGEAPVQGCGRIDGYPWYFRARGDGWDIEIADDKSIDPNRLPMVGFEASGWEMEGNWGSDYEASYMPFDIAWELIASAVEAFRDGTLPYVEKDD